MGVLFLEAKDCKDEDILALEILITK